MVVAEEIGHMIIESDDKKKFLSEEYNTVSIGVIWSEEQMTIVILLSANIAGFTKITTTDNGINVEGEISLKDWQVGTAKLVYQDYDVIDHENNDLAIQIGPKNIDFFADEQRFICHFEIPEMIDKPQKKVICYLFKGKKYIEFL